MSNKSLENDNASYELNDDDTVVFANKTIGKLISSEKTVVINSNIRAHKPKVEDLLKEEGLNVSEWTVCSKAVYNADSKVVDNVDITKLSDLDFALAIGDIQIHTVETPDGTRHKLPYKTDIDEINIWGGRLVPGRLLFLEQYRPERLCVELGLRDKFDRPVTDLKEAVKVTRPKVVPVGPGFNPMSHLNAKIGGDVEQGGTAQSYVNSSKLAKAHISGFIYSDKEVDEVYAGTVNSILSKKIDAIKETRLNY